MGILSHPDDPTDSSESGLDSGLDLIVNLSLPVEEITRRITGRKIDPQTKIFYHITDNPPNSDVKGLNERLVAVNDEHNEDISGKYQGFISKIDGMEEWYKRFGKFDRKGNFRGIWQEINSVGKIYEVYERIEGHIYEILEEKHEIYEKMLENEGVVKQDIEENSVKMQDIIEEKKIESFHGDNLDIEAGKMLWNLWDETQNIYIKDLYKTLNKIKENR